jgi:hypothetical protein
LGCFDALAELLIVDDITPDVALGCFDALGELLIVDDITPDVAATVASFAGHPIYHPLVRDRGEYSEEFYC